MKIIWSSTSNVCRESFIGIQSHPLISVSVLSAAAFVINLHWQSVITATGAVWAAKLKYSLSGPLQKKVCGHLRKHYLRISLRLEV